MTPKNVDKTIHDKAPVVVSPPSAPDLNSLLTGHVRHDGGLQVADGAATMDIVEDPADDNVKSPKKKNSKKVKLTKEDKLSKRNHNGSSLKKSSFGMPAVVATSSAKEYKFERVFYEAGLELKGDNKYDAYVSHIRNLLKTLCWSTRLQLCMRLMSPGVQSLLAPSQK